MRTNYICSKTPKGLSCYYVSNNGSKAKASVKLSTKKRSTLRDEFEKKKVDLQPKMSKLRPKFHLSGPKTVKKQSQPSSEYREEKAQKIDLKNQENSILKRSEVNSTPVEQEKWETDSVDRIMDDIECETKPFGPLDCGEDLKQDVGEYFSLKISKLSFLSPLMDSINPLGVMIIYNIETRAMMLPPIYRDGDRCILVRITPKQLAQLIQVKDNDPELLIANKWKAFDSILKQSSPNWIYKVFLFNQPKTGEMAVDLDLPFEIVYGDSTIHLFVEPSALITNDSKDTNYQDRKTSKPENFGEKSPQKPSTPSTLRQPQPCGSNCKDNCHCHGCCCGCSKENIVQVNDEDKKEEKQHAYLLTPPRLQTGYEEVLEIFGYFTFPSEDD